MAWYTTGTISVTNGSATVTGSGTQFITGAQVGEGLLENGQLYEIQSIESATSLTLAKTYLGATQSGLNYEIVPTQSLVADLANNVSSLIGDFQSVVDNAGAGKFSDGTVATPGISFTQDQNNGLYRIGADNWGLVAGGVKVVDVTSTGIDVTGTAPLTVSGDTTQIRLENTASGGRNWALRTFGSALGIYDHTAGAFRQYIDSSGNVLVGKATTDFNTEGCKLSASGHITKNLDTVFNFNRTGNSGMLLGFQQAGGTVGSVSVTGTTTAYNTSSDYRLKEDWQPIANATETFMQLKPCNFAWKVDGTRVDGFLAHELQEVIPCAATGEKDGMRTEEYEVSPAVYEDAVIPAIQEVLDEEGNVITEAQEERTEQNLVSEAVMGEREVPDMQGIDQSKIVPLLTAALQQAITKTRELEARITALES